MKKYYFLFLVSILLSGACKKNEPVKNPTLFVGTYTENGSEGIYSYTFNASTGELVNKKLAAAIGNPSFVKISPDKKYLYAVEETDSYENSSGGVAAFSIANGNLIKINSDATVGAHPCHIGLSADGRFLAASSYTGGSLTIFGLGENGGLLPKPQYIDHKVLDSAGTSHAHAAKFTKDGLFVADLGLDAILRYELKGTKWVPYQQPPLVMAPKAGPRHFTFGQQGRFLYVINELNSTITVLQRNNDSSYAEVETQTTLAKDFKRDSFCADIHLSRDGKFLYGSNRGENTIVIFEVDQTTGKLSLLGRESVHGDWPRNFGIDPSGNFLLVANQRSNNITIYRRNVDNGLLNFLHEVELPSPVCLEFLDL
ncbi:MAG: lactonase family protein [Arenibacter sp.]|nr:lactonase family protein [Arenibacter sp.]